MPQPDFLELLDAQGVSHGAWLSPELWERAKAHILSLAEQTASAPGTSVQPAPEHYPEPMADWQTLLAYWDWAYPPSYEVTCEHCGNTTQDWTKDSPRKFRLRAANLGGQVTFQCQSCRALILKKHFKKHIAVECQPYVDHGQA